MKLPQLQIGKLLPQFPIIQGGMAVRISTAPLVAAVANAGGIGVLGATGMSSTELRQEIQTARRLTSGPIGVNVMFAIKNFSNLVHTAIEEKIDVIFTGAGFSRDIFSWGREAGIPIVSIVSSAKLSVMAEKLGASAVVVEGTEAGGHLGTDKPLQEILPGIRKAIKIPLIAAGGIIDGRGMAKMFKLGADGVQMATRFVLSKECAVADSFKQMYLKAKPEDITLVESPVGMQGRALRNPFVNRIEQNNDITPKKCSNCLKKCTKKYCIMEALENSSTGNTDEGLVFSGSNVHLIKEILSVKEIFDKLLREVEEVDDLEDFNDKIGGGIVGNQLLRGD